MEIVPFIAFLILSLLYAGILHHIIFIKITCQYILFYTGVVIAWGINWYLHKQHSRIPLHWFIGITILLQFVVMVLLAVFFGVLPEDARYLTDTTYSIAITADGFR